MTDTSKLSELLKRSISVSNEINASAIKALRALDGCLTMAEESRCGDLLVSDLETIREELTEIINQTEES